ncbi:hypothetical protein [Streptomyces sp.]|jgi:hypothetical protein|uniref:hypothetical protein n=1 Tax=Streptomyces sp. TaxID=1931 RepID=UPI000A4377B0
MERATAMVEFFRARLDEEEAELARMTSGALVQGYLRVYGDRLKANVQADRALLYRYDYCVEMGGCLGNEGLDVIREEYEDLIFPARISRFGDHPAWASLAANVWVERDYLDARDAGGSTDAR